MPRASASGWAFARRLRRGAYGWRSAPAVKSVKEAVAEIKKVARADLVRAAEGAVLFLERVSPAIENVDGSSGSMGGTVHRAVETMVGILGKADVDAPTRAAWLERLWDAFEADEIPYIESLGEHWGTACASPALASAWADRLLDQTRWALLNDSEEWRFFQGSQACLSALFAAERHEELLAVLARTDFWPYRRWAVRALAALGRKADAINLAESAAGERDGAMYAQEIATLCEEIYLSSGMRDQAYRRYALAAHSKTTYLATFRAVRKAYPEVPVADVLEDLVAATPGEEGKWFAAAKSAGLLEEALALARRSPCDPHTLVRAARDFAEKDPGFAVEAGLLAVAGMIRGDAYEITDLDVLDAYAITLDAARVQGTHDATQARLRGALQHPGPAREFVLEVLKDLEQLP